MCLNLQNTHIIDYFYRTILQEKYEHLKYIYGTLDESARILFDHHMYVLYIVIMK